MKDVRAFRAETGKGDGKVGGSVKEEQERMGTERKRGWRGK